MRRDVNSFVEKTEPYMATGGREPLEVDLPISDFRITGRLDGAGLERLVQYRYAKVTCKDRLSLWVRHLVLNSLNMDDGAKTGIKTSMLIGLSKSRGQLAWAAWEYPAVEQSKAYLEKLLEIYWDGLCRPVHLFPESSWTYARLLLENNRPEQEALEAARKTWCGDDYRQGECDDPYYQCCFGEINVLDSEFKKTAVDILGPLLAGQKEVKR